MRGKKINFPFNDIKKGEISSGNNFPLLPSHDYLRSHVWKAISLFHTASTKARGREIYAFLHSSIYIYGNWKEIAIIIMQMLPTDGGNENFSINGGNLTIKRRGKFIAALSSSSREVFSFIRL